MKLEHLKLTNFRGFRELSISFDPSFTVLLGGNMAGKTAVLEAAGRVLSWLLGEEQSQEITDGDVHRIVAESGGTPVPEYQFPVSIEPQTWDPRPLGKRSTWFIYRDGPDKPTRVGPIPDAFLNRPIDEDLPLIAHYGADRRWNRQQAADDIRGLGARYDGYVGAFDIRSTQGMMAGWMRRQTYVELQKGNGYTQPQLAGVETAVKSCIADATAFRFDVQYDELRLERSSGDLQSFSMLSEGYRTMVAMVADIAWRAAVLNPHHGPEAHLRTGGIVLIDELDLHLHPAWQRRVVDDLRRTFPNIQFIVTTHSPQIVASVTRSQVRILEQNRLVAEEPHVEGRDSNALLEDVFGVASRPEEVQAEIDELYRSIEDQDYPRARDQLAALRERLGPDDAAMIRATWLLDTEDPTSRASASSPP